MNPLCLNSVLLGEVDAELARPELLHPLFEREAHSRPDAVALEIGGRPWSYRELDSAANRVARWLRYRSVGRGDCVAFWLPRSAEMYVAILGILKSGAAYVPLDPEYPADRVSYILDDCRVPVLFTTNDLAAKLSAHVEEDKTNSTAVVTFDELISQSANDSVEPLTVEETRVTPEDLCYVIYTSGSTGRPKGVQIEHRSASHLVRVEQRLFEMRPEDRVYQGFSLAFDASVEEVWLAFASGATLVVGTAEMQHAGAALPRMLTDAGITVLSCVPTLLLMMEDDIPTLRLLITGGEQCAPDLVRRWWRPTRRMFNTYGPTEATVIATFVECHPDRPVTIGKPLPNYSVRILDSKMHPLPVGEVGELCIGGVGLARGYVNRPDLTAEKFIDIPNFNGRLYRTGDLSRITVDGEIEFLGRIDSQVKLRGYRIELSEIEAVLLECPHVRAAAVTLREESSGVQQLLGYVVVREGESFDESAARDLLRSKLPPYMVPGLIDVLDELPTLTSGKVDRKRLPAPKTRGGAEVVTIPVGRTPREQRLAEAFAKRFAPLPVTLTDDFFRDLGGHSLLAARMVSELRQDTLFAALSMTELYQHPTIESLAGHLDQLAAVHLQSRSASATESQSTRGEREVHHPSAFAHFVCGCAQFFALYFVMAFFALQWIGPYVVYAFLYEHDFEIIESLIGAFTSFVLVYPVMLLIAVLVKWAVLGRVRPGRYPLWGVYFFRWWFTQSILSSIPIDYLAGTPLLGLFYRVMGAKIGRNVHLGSNLCVGFDLFSVGDDSCIGVDTDLSECSVEDGWLKLGRIDIGQRCFVGTRSVLGQNTQMEDDSALEELSLLPNDTMIRRSERWRGSPAQPLPRRPDETTRIPQAERPSFARRLWFGVLHAIGVLVVPLLGLAAIFPGILAMHELNYLDDYYWYLLLSPLVALSFVVLLCLQIIAVKWLVQGRVRPGTFPLNSLAYFKKWFVDALLELSLDTLGTLYSTIYLAPWYRLLGAKIGKRTEISTASFISPDLLDLDDEVFIADAVSLGAARVEHGQVTIGHTRVGRRSFVGNSALLPPGTEIGEGCLIGVLSTPPISPTAATAETVSVPNGSTWLGSPAFLLPRRQEWSVFSESQTFHPSRKLWVQRGLIEFVRIILPATGFISLTSVLLSLVAILQDEIGTPLLAVLFPILYGLAGIVSLLIVAVLKWTLIGRYHRGQHPLWSLFVWRNELITALFENFSNLYFTQRLLGTPLLPWALRLFGVKIGRGVYLDSSEITEFDLVTIGDHVAINSDATIQTHLFEDRVMKIGEVHIGPRCNVGSLSVVLYDTLMEPDSSLGDLSLLMKEESLPAHTRWEGIPARKIEPD